MELQVKPTLIITFFLTILIHSRLVHPRNLAGSPSPAVPVSVHPPIFQPSYHLVIYSENVKICVGQWRANRHGEKPVWTRKWKGKAGVVSGSLPLKVQPMHALHASWSDSPGRRAGREWVLSPSVEMYVPWHNVLTLVTRTHPIHMEFFYLICESHFCWFFNHH